MNNENPYIVPADIQETMQECVPTSETPKAFQRMPQLFFVSIVVTYGIHLLCSSNRDVVNSLLPSGATYPLPNSVREKLMLLFTTGILPILYYRLLQTIEYKEMTE